MVALGKGMKTGGIEVPLSDDYQNPRTLVIKREGILGFDIFNKNRGYTPWEEIKDIIVEKDKLTFISRLPVDINVAKVAAHGIVQIINTSPVLVNPLTDTQLHVSFDLDTEDERCITFWRDNLASLILYLRQSGLIGKVSDGAPVYKRQIPEIIFKCKVPSERDFMVRSEPNVPGHISVLETRKFATFHEYAKELQENVIIIDGVRWRSEYYDPKHEAGTHFFSR